VLSSVGFGLQNGRHLYWTWYECLLGTCSSSNTGSSSRVNIRIRPRPRTVLMPVSLIITRPSIDALELTNALQNPAPAAPFSHIGTAHLQALRQLSDIFSAALPSGTAQHTHPFTQNSSQFRITVPPGCITQPRMLEVPVPAAPTRSPYFGPHRSQRVSPSRVPSPRVAPRMNPSDIASPRVATPLPLADVIPLTPHPAEKMLPMHRRAWQV
jgi:hypothetical protein